MKSNILRHGAAGVHEKCKVQGFQPRCEDLCGKEKFEFGFRDGLFVYFLPKQKPDSYRVKRETNERIKIQYLYLITKYKSQFILHNSLSE